MNLSMYRKEVFRKYKSNSQRARVLSEGWFSAKMYCPCCLNPHVRQFPNNERASDFLCERCKSRFQLKCSSRSFGKKVVDGEYRTMTGAILSDIAPNLQLMHYSPGEWIVEDLSFIPKFFISPSLVEKRNPLRETARRAGWIGCNLLLNRIPKEGIIPIIKNEHEIDRKIVHRRWKRMSFLSKKRPHLRGWTSDVLKCIEELSSKEFTLNEAYDFKKYLQELHPDNRHIEAKIRQQLQVLRDNNIVRFVSPGKYQLLR